ncbi:hypothetical protein B0H13DRAFT_1618025, partial [Mycena leptocephala]
LKRARRELPSFSHHITWAEVAAFFPSSESRLSVHYIRPHPSNPSCFLPPSFHEELFVRSWAAMDVYSEPTENLLEAPKVRLLEIYLVPIISLFAGRIEDLPKIPMEKTELSSGGPLTTRFAFPQQLDTFVAQLFSELYAAAQMNAKVGLENLKVYGILTDLGIFHFFAFEPKSKMFYRDPKIVVARGREDFLIGMMHVTEKIFSVVLEAYIDTLEATYHKITQRSGAGSVCVLTF